MKPLRWTMAAVLGVLPLVLGQGCPWFQPVITSLAEGEGPAIASVVEAAAGLTQAVAAVQTPASEDSSPLPAGTNTTGTCPAITTQLAEDAEEGIAASLTIDFGSTPCEPTAMPGRFCSGSATGVFNRPLRSIVITFNQLTCGQDALSGSAEMSYLPTETGIYLYGSFDLDWTSGADQVTTRGQGNYTYNRDSRTSRIGLFNGSVTDAGTEYAVGFNDVVVSYQNNANLVPSSGVISLSGTTIRNLRVRFDESSPTTGEVEVSVNGSAYFTVNLFEL
ncbi:MAG: hypothetical protein HRF43_08310 [Phycisphaerae bacterium]